MVVSVVSYECVCLWVNVKMFEEKRLIKSSQFIESHSECGSWYKAVWLSVSGLPDGSEVCWSLWTSDFWKGRCVKRQRETAASDHRDRNIARKSLIVCVGGHVLQTQPDNEPSAWYQRSVWSWPPIHTLFSSHFLFSCLRNFFAVLPVMLHF